ncbi:hypothetical protein GCM10009122_01910 [Fulvivirga kasyanovii]|uniref:Uncharacterized protein n=1 Tax=Fulvivirga kasyanovii TaxID=396812 RepID=A0ABW9RYV6_9BACT|nr:hypothetical protein [Fulvivirga kasyanovii]MTI28220.1 hypothetical protein [Fulvivirga kasyanovii]
MFYTLKINAVHGNSTPTENEVTIKFNKAPQHGKIHFVALDHKMASNIYRRKTGHQKADKYQVEITCYDNEQRVTYLNSREIA